MRIIFALWLAIIAASVPLGTVQAHALEPGYLEIEPLGDSQWQITWRKPAVQGRPMAIDVELPEGCDPRRGPDPRFDGRAYVSGWIASCDPQIWNGAVFIDGLADTATDVLIRYTPTPDAPSQTLRLTPDATSAQLAEVPTGWGVLTSYFALGLEHILGGIDHLLFVFALLLLIPDTRRLIWAITAFTIAHSLTLAAAALELVYLPIPPVEAVIALSIVFLAGEILAQRKGRRSLIQTSPWVASFAFGLLHGLGFASALREIGLPHGEVPVALVSFNLGVEAGQLLFVAGVLVLAQSVRFFAPQLVNRRSGFGDAGLVSAAYGIGAVAAFWTIERVMAFLV
jgi:hydrogenase/urease accessory protein HupE